MIFHFFDEVEEFQSRSSSCGSSSIDFDGGETFNHEVEEEEEDEAAATGSKAEAAEAFWDSQEELLRTTSSDSRIKQTTKEALVELNSTGFNVSARKGLLMAAGNVCEKKTAIGFRKMDSVTPFASPSGKANKIFQPGSIPTWKWFKIQHLKTSEVKVIIELNFKSEFMVARGCEEYNRLIDRLPDVYVGKNERLKALIKILCSASKKCMKENKMHMAPWWKHKYMQAKWLGKPEKQPALFLPAFHIEIRPSRPKASMLTFDFLDNLKTLRPATMIEVL